jgi:hypothetical protein
MNLTRRNILTTFFIAPLVAAAARFLSPPPPPPSARGSRADWEQHFRSYLRETAAVHFIILDAHGAPYTTLTAYYQHPYLLNLAQPACAVPVSI